MFELALLQAINSLEGQYLPLQAVAAAEDHALHLGKSLAAWQCLASSTSMGVPGDVRMGRAVMARYGLEGGCTMRTCVSRCGAM